MLNKLCDAFKTRTHSNINPVTNFADYLENVNQAQNKIEQNIYICQSGRKRFVEEGDSSCFTEAFKEGGQPKWRRYWSYIH